MAIKELSLAIDGKLTVENDDNSTKIVDLTKAVSLDESNQITDSASRWALQNASSSFVPTGTKVALFGDSRFFQSAQGGRDQTLWIYNVDSLLGGSINTVQHLAFGGAWLTNAMSEQLVNARSDIGCFISDMGINDIILSRKTLAEIQTAHRAIMAWMKARNAYWIDTTTTTAAVLTLAERNVLAAFNEWKLTNNHGYDKYKCVDLARHTNKMDLSGIRDGWHDLDDLHLNMTGAWGTAFLVKPDFEKLFSPLPLEPEYHQFLYNPALENFTSGTYGPLPSGLGIDVADGASVVSSLSYDYNPSGSWKLVVTGTTATSHAYLSIGSLALYPWSASKFLQKGNCILPTVAKSVMYRATTDGNIASGADPTASWSNVIGTRFVSGGVTLQVVPAMSFQTHDLGVYAEIDYANSTAPAGIDWINYGFNGGTFLFGTSSANLVNQIEVPLNKQSLKIRTGGIPVPGAITHVTPQLRIWAPTGVTTTVYISRIAATLTGR